MLNMTQFQFGNTDISPYTKFLTQSLKEGTFKTPSFNANFTMPLDFTSKTFTGAMLPQTYQKAMSAKIEAPKNNFFSQKGITNSSNAVKSGLSPTAIGNIASIGNMGLDLIGSLAPKLDHVSGASNALKIGSKIAGAVPIPGAQIASLAMNGIATLDQLLGKSAKQQATAGATATGYNLEFNANAGTSYGGLFGNKARKRTDVLSKKQDSSNIQKMAVSNANNQNLLAASNSYQAIADKNRIQKQGGINTGVLAASKGTKLSLSKIANKVLSKEKEEPKEVKMNVIPSGALHARKNNMPEEIAEQVTNKGIPVVTFEDEGKIIQHCEVEKEELTLHKELTVKLEDLLSQYKDAKEEEKDKILIKTGKLLTYEILENTQDNVDLINKIE